MWTKIRGKKEGEGERKMGKEKRKLKVKEKTRMYTLGSWATYLGRVIMGYLMPCQTTLCVCTKMLDFPEGILEVLFPPKR